MRLEPNVSVAYALLARNHAVPPSGPGYDAAMSKWRELSHDSVYIWGYNADFKNFILPTPTFWNLGPELRDYKKRNVRGVGHQLPWGSLSDFVYLRCWLFAKLAWNPDQDENALIAEWIDGTCGAGAPDVLAYVALLKKAVGRKEVWITAYDKSVRHWMTPEDILEARELFAHAAAATAGDPRANAWIRKLSASVIMATIVEYSRVSAYAAEKTVALPSYYALVDELEALGKEFKCGCWREWEGFGDLIKGLRSRTQAPNPKPAEAEPAEPLPGLE